LVRDDPIAGDFVLYKTSHFDVTTTDFNDGPCNVKSVCRQMNSRFRSCGKEVHGVSYEEAVKCCNCGGKHKAT
jgi:hypothetical protein